VTVRDDGGTIGGGIDTVVRAFTVTVLAVNDAPSFVKGADQEAKDTSGDVTVPAWATAVSAGPADEAGQSLSFTVSVDNADLFATLPQISPSGQLSFTPALNAEGTALVTVILQDNGGTEHGGVNVSASQTFSIDIAKLHPLHNEVKPLDVNGDNHIAPNDALAGIDYINAFGTCPVSAHPEQTKYLDVNGDGFISPADPLMDINYINAHGSGEAESSVTADLASVSTMNDPSLTTTLPNIVAPARPSVDLNSIIALLAYDTAQQPQRRRPAL
jgi:hypothetical protein